MHNQPTTLKQSKYNSRVDAEIRSVYCKLKNDNVEFYWTTETDVKLE